MFCDDLNGLVLDIGHFKSTIGFIGDETPAYHTNSNYGINDENEKTYLNDLFNSNNKEIKNILVDEEYPDIERMLEFSKKMANKINSKINESPVIFTDQNTSNQREKITECFFESGNVSNFFLVKKSTLTCFANGKNSGLIIESGSQFNQVCPVIDGFLLQKSCYKNYLAGDHLNDIFKEYLEKLSNSKIEYPYESYIKEENDKNEFIKKLKNKFSNNQRNFLLNNSIREIKEYFCREINNSYSTNNKMTEIELPDGKKVEAMFDFDLISSIFDINNKDNIQNIVSSAIENTDIDIRKDLLSNIVIAGGNSLFYEFVETFEKKLGDVAPSNSKIKIVAYPKSMERRFSSWIGGSILSSTAAFQNLWISKFEYEEYGSSIVMRKLV